MRRRIPLHYLDGLGHPLADCLPAAPPAGDLRQRQYQRSLEPPFALDVARALVKAKIFNQHRALHRLETNRPVGLGEDLEHLAQSQEETASAADRS